MSGLDGTSTLGTGVLASTAALNLLTA